MRGESNAAAAGAAVRRSEARWLHAALALRGDPHGLSVAARLVPPAEAVAQLDACRVVVEDDVLAAPGAVHAPGERSPQWFCAVADRRLRLVQQLLEPLCRLVDLVGVGAVAQPGGHERLPGGGEVVD